MINLLPDDFKKELRASRTNVTLLNYLIILAVGVIFLAVLFVGVYYVLTNTKSDAQSIIKQNNSKTSALASTEQQALSLRASLSTAKVILDQEVDYSKVVTGIAQVMPAGTVLASLSLSSTTFGTPIILQANAKSIDDALALKDSFSKSSLFSNVSIQTLTSTGGTASGYSTSVSLGLTINKSAAK
jgi:Tfp pilus assembly protein PilN